MVVKLQFSCLKFWRPPSKSLLCLYPFLLTWLFFQSLKKQRKQRTPCTTLHNLPPLAPWFLWPCLPVAHDGKSNYCDFLPNIM